MTIDRNSPRFPVKIEVHFSLYDDPQSDQLGTLLTASPFGVFLMTPTALKEDEIVEIILPLEGYPLHVLGRVAWISPQDPVGVGVEFQGLDETTREEILETIDSGQWLRGDLGDEPDIFTIDTDDIIADLG